MILYTIDKKILLPLSFCAKKKFVLECGEVIPLIYGVFRAETDRSYPLGSSWIKSFCSYTMLDVC